MDLLVKVDDAEADFVLQLLGKFDFVEVEKRQAERPVENSRRELEFSALKLNTNGWKFDREEANER